MGVRINERGIRITGSLKGALDAPLDLRLDGRRIWSFRPRRDGVRAGRRTLLVPWPDALAGVLDGRADVDVVPHRGGDPVFTGALLFGESDDPVDLADDTGNPLALDRSGRLRRSFEDPATSARRELVEAAHQVLVDLRDACGLDVFLSHGGLLGGTRSGHLLGHDVDLAFFSAYRHPFDVIRECRETERRMRELGWQLVRTSAAGFRVSVPLPSGKRAPVDVLAAFHVGSTFHLAGSLVGTLDRAALLPLGRVELDGVGFPAPADVPAFLEFVYGPDWAEPDPAFRFEHPPANVRRMAQWFRGTRSRLSYWQEFYAGETLAALPTGPSWFAEWVDARIEPGSPLVELGAGNGRDTLWFTEQGHPTIGSDYCAAARSAADRAARDAGVPLTFTSINPESLYSVLVTAAGIAHEPEPRHIYARGLIDVLAPSGRNGLWRFCAIAGRRGGRTFLEFRTPTRRTRGTQPSPHEIVAEIEQYGGRVTEKLERRGLAALGKEDPVICRLVVSWEKS